MTYTPINWQAGDTITADKLNKMDNGWGVESTQLFSETVTTAIDPEYPDDPPYGSLTYAGFIDAGTLSVSFDGTDYVCSREIAYNGYFYGDEEVLSPPFCIYSQEGFGNSITTLTAGNHTVSVNMNTLEASQSFADAVTSCVEPSAIKCVPNVTRVSDIGGKALPFFYEPNNTTKLHIITIVDTTCTIFPESDTITAHFSRDSGLFYITES